MSKSSDYQLRQILARLSGDRNVLSEAYLPAIQDVLGHLVAQGALRLPFDIARSYVTYERMGVLSQVAVRPAKSNLGQILMSRPEEVGLFVDPGFSSAASVFCVALLKEPEEVCAWLRAMSRPEALIRPMDKTGELGTVIAAPIGSFTALSSSGG